MQIRDLNRLHTSKNRLYAQPAGTTRRPKATEVSPNRPPTTPKGACSRGHYSQSVALARNWFRFLIYPPTPLGSTPWLRGLTGAEINPDKRFSMGKKRNRLTNTKSLSGSAPIFWTWSKSTKVTTRHQDLPKRPTHPTPPCAASWGAGGRWSPAPWGCPGGVPTNHPRGPPRGAMGAYGGP